MKVTDQQKDFDSYEEFLLCQMSQRGDSSSDSDDITLAKYKKFENKWQKKPLTSQK